MHSCPDRFSPAAPTQLGRFGLAFIGWLMYSHPKLLAQEYVPSDLDSNSLTGSASALALNDTGIAVGGGLPFGVPYVQAAQWTPNGTEVLPTLPGDSAGYAYDVNHQGVVGGESDHVQIIGQLTIITPHAVLWDQGQVIDIQTLIQTGGPIEAWSVAALNDRPQYLLTGRYQGQAGFRGFVLENGVLTDIGSLPTTQLEKTIARDLNELGQVVGYSDVTGGFRHAFSWANGVMQDLHIQGGFAGRTSSANAINNCGQVCGAADYIGDLIDWETATLWDTNQVVSIGTLGGQQSIAWDLNDHGDVVGGAIDGLNRNRAFIYRQGVLQDLNDLIPPNTGWELLSAEGINNDGRIVGTGSFQSALRPFLLTPDRAGGFSLYGQGCAGTDGWVPQLRGTGCPSPGETLRFSVSLGLGGAAARMFVGNGVQTLEIAPGCELQVLPLLPQRFDFNLVGSGAGRGWQNLPVRLPQTTPLGDYFVQVILEDPGPAHGFSLTQPLEIQVR